MVELADGAQAARLSMIFGARRVEAVLAALSERGLLASIPSGLAAPDEGALDPRLVVCGDAGRAFARALSSAATGWETEARIVIADSFLRPDVVNATGDQPWLLVKVGSESVWVSPVFGPTRAPCWECTRTRLLARDDRLAGLWYGGHRPEMVTAAPPAFTPRLITSVAAEIDRQSRADGECGTLAQLTYEGESRAHRVAPMARCASCARGRGRSGGRGLTSSWQALQARLGPLLDDVTGVVALHDVHDNVNDSGATVAVSTYANPDVESGRAPSSPGPAARFAYGAAFSADDARLRAVLEGVERYSGASRGESSSLRATLADLGSAAISPNELMHFSLEQLAAGGPGIPLPCRQDVPLAWCTAVSLDSGSRWLPTSYCEKPPDDDLDALYCVYESNGTAVGMTLEDAIVSGFLEVVERDAVAIWWYNRLRRPEVKIESFRDQRIDAFANRVRDTGASLRVFDVTADIAVTTFVALSVDPSGVTPRFGFGAHFDAHAALRAALLELAQAICFEAQETLKWEAFDWSEQPHLTDAATVSRTADDYDERPEAPSVRRCAQAAAAVDAEVLVRDCTRADIQVPCVKVVVPELRSVAPRFGPGRLFGVPVGMGWLDVPHEASRLNPEPLRM
jgi:oxazoline/thiazoline synthase